MHAYRHGLHILPIWMRTKEFIIGITCLFLSPSVLAWGAQGHRIIGAAAFEMLDDTARSEVLSLLGNPPESDMAESLAAACTWPDTVRKDAKWNWSAPLHYVNIPRHTPHYDRERDCPDGRCVAEGIVHFANRLAYPSQDNDKRFQDFAFVCHLVADLHQPLHAGFRDDRGANAVDIEFRGEEWNLHQFWDSVNVRAHLEDEPAMVQSLVSHGRGRAAAGWNPAEVKAWAEESHALAAEMAYPESRVIVEVFSQRSWELTVSQWQLASERLARVLNAALGESEVILDD